MTLSDAYKLADEIRRTAYATVSGHSTSDFGVKHFSNSDPVTFQEKTLSLHDCGGSEYNVVLEDRLSGIDYLLRSLEDWEEWKKIRGI